MKTMACGWSWARANPGEAAREMIKRNPEKLAKWLDGVSTFDGKPALATAKAAFGF